MRISDWSSDVCSSDLEKVGELRMLPAREFPTDKEGIETFRKRYRDHFPGDLSRSRIYADVSKGMMPGGIESWLPLFFNDGTSMLTDYLPTDAVLVAIEEQNGRAPCRERVCQYGEIAGVDVSLKKKKNKKIKQQ